MFNSAHLIHWQLLNWLQLYYPANPGQEHRFKFITLPDQSKEPALFSTGSLVTSRIEIREFTF